jgi:hypothetical protein
VLEVIFISARSDALRPRAWWYCLQRIPLQVSASCSFRFLVDSVVPLGTQWKLAIACFVMFINEHRPTGEIGRKTR